MRYIMLTVAYDGTNYVGWQVQPNGVSIQQRLEEAWTATTQETVRIMASGRTDSGVHALGQVCSVATSTRLNCDAIQGALNANTPEDIFVVAVKLAPENFHAIRDASRKTYRYQIQFGPIHNPLSVREHWYCRQNLNITAMREAAKYLIGEHDFASFQAVGSERKSTVRNLTKLFCQEDQEGPFQYLRIELTCNGFLYNMVRNIVGTLVHVGQGRESADWVRFVLNQKDRSVAGPTAPAHGLILVNVEYDDIHFKSDHD